MRTGWNRQDKAMFGLSAFLVVWGVVMMVAWHQWLAGYLLAIQGTIHATQRLYLRSAHNLAWSTGRTAMVLSLGEAMQLPVRGMNGGVMDVKFVDLAGRTCRVCGRTPAVLPREPRRHRDLLQA